VLTETQAIPQDLHSA